MSSKSTFWQLKSPNECRHMKLNSVLDLLLKKRERFGIVLVLHIEQIRREYVLCTNKNRAEMI